MHVGASLDDKVTSEAVTLMNAAWEATQSELAFILRPSALGLDWTPLHQLQLHYRCSDSDSCSVQSSPVTG